MTRANFLTDDQVDDLQEMLREFRARRQNPARPRPAEPIPQAPETYLARVPAGGIPARSEETAGTGTGTTTEATDDIFGFADCAIYRLVGTGASARLLPIHRIQTVYNQTLTAVAEGTLILVTRDKFGYWCVAGNQGAAASGSGTASAPGYSVQLAEDVAAFPGVTATGNFTSSPAFRYDTTTETLWVGYGAVVGNVVAYDFQALTSYTVSGGGLSVTVTAGNIDIQYQNPPGPGGITITETVSGDLIVYNGQSVFMTQIATSNALGLQVGPVSITTDIGAGLTSYGGFTGLIGPGAQAIWGWVVDPGLDLTGSGPGVLRQSASGGAVDVFQSSTTGTTSGFTQHTGATVRVDSTFDGGLSGTAYTIGDLMAAAINSGLLAP